MRSLLRPILTVTALAGVAAAIVLVPTPDDPPPPPVTDPVALSADDPARRRAVSFVGAHSDPGYPDLTPEAGDPGTHGEEPIGYPEVVAASAEAPRAAPEPASSGSVDGSVWDRLAMCESSGNWASTVGLYEGGLQFHPDTWDAYKPVGYPDAAYQASRAQQILVAERVLAQQGWGAWPACSRKLGLR